MSEHSRIIVTPRLLLGAWIALMGVVLMLDRIGLIDAGQAFRLWPLLLVAAGASLYFQGPKDAGRVNGGILMVVGVWLLLRSLGVIRVGFWDLFWPMVLIAGGTALVMQTLRRGREPGATGDASNRLTVFAVMSGVQRANASPRFQGGDVLAFMGGCRLDLRQATIPDGEEATIDVLTVMGGCEIVVPPNWVVVTPAVPFMGSIEDHRLVPIGAVPSALPAPRLVLRGFVMMGGLHIKG